MNFDDAFARCGIVAILRGIRTDEVEQIGRALVDAGITIAEIPLNSPGPFASIKAMAAAFKDKLIVGAGTVLSVQDVNMLREHDGEISVSPDCNPDVIKRARELGIVPLPGVFTPTEAFAAVRAGARHLKLFPAEAASPTTIKAWRAVISQNINLLAVGGVTPESMKNWIDAGTNGFGIGSNIYKPGKSAAEVKSSARAFVAAWDEIKGKRT
jgi:2-dehydro-3-deoxyphosphogalactonate aldolase